MIRFLAWIASRISNFYRWCVDFFTQKTYPNHDTGCKDKKDKNEKQRLIHPSSETVPLPDPPLSAIAPVTGPLVLNVDTSVTEATHILKSAISNLPHHRSDLFEQTWDCVFRYLHQKLSPIVFSDSLNTSFFDTSTKRFMLLVNSELDCGQYALTAPFSEKKDAFVEFYKKVESLSLVEFYTNLLSHMREKIAWAQELADRQIAEIAINADKTESVSAKIFARCGHLNVGYHYFFYNTDSIDSTALTPGIYFYRTKAAINTIFCYVRHHDKTCHEFDAAVFLKHYDIDLFNRLLHEKETGIELKLKYQLIIELEKKCGLIHLHFHYEDGCFIYRNTDLQICCIIKYPGSSDSVEYLNLTELLTQKNQLYLIENLPWPSVADGGSGWGDYENMILSNTLKYAIRNALACPDRYFRRTCYVSPITLLHHQINALYSIDIFECVDWSNGLNYHILDEFTLFKKLSEKIQARIDYLVRLYAVKDASESELKIAFKNHRNILIDIIDQRDNMMRFLYKPTVDAGTVTTAGPRSVSYCITDNRFFLQDTNPYCEPWCFGWGSLYCCYSLDQLADFLTLKEEIDMRTMTTLRKRLNEDYATLPRFFDKMSDNRFLKLRLEKEIDYRMWNLLKDTKRCELDILKAYMSFHEQIQTLHRKTSERMDSRYVKMIQCTLDQPCHSNYFFVNTRQKNSRPYI